MKILIQSRGEAEIDYILDLDAPMCLRWFLFINRLPAVETVLCSQNGVAPQLYADYKNKRVRVTMASSMGDVGITNNLSKESGYNSRVAVEELSNFSDKS